MYLKSSTLFRKKKKKKKKKQQRNKKKTKRTRLRLTPECQHMHQASRLKIIRVNSKNMVRRFVEHSRYNHVWFEVSLDRFEVSLDIRNPIIKHARSFNEYEPVTRHPTFKSIVLTCWVPVHGRGKNYQFPSRYVTNFRPSNQLAKLIWEQMLTISNDTNWTKLDTENDTKWKLISMSVLSVNAVIVVGHRFYGRWHVTV